MEHKIKNSWINLNKLTVYSEDKKSKLIWGMRAGYPRITVFHNLEDGLGRKADYKNMLTAPFTIDGISDFFVLFQKVLESKEPLTYSVDCINMKWEDGVKTDKRFVQAKVTVGIDEKGLYFIQVEAEDKATGKFIFKPSEWFRFYKDNNPIESDTVLSKIAAKAYFRNLDTVMYRYIEEQEMEQVRRPIDKGNSTAPEYIL